MMIVRFQEWLAAVALLLWTATVASSNSTPAALCSAAKAKAAGQEARRVLLCHALAVRNGVAVDDECLAAAAMRLGDAFARAESRGGCLTVDDADAIRAIVDAFADSVLAALPSMAPSPTSSPPQTPTVTSSATPTPTADSSGTATPVSGIKRLFVTSFLPLGNFGGLSGADAYCQGLAASASLSGNFKAWLSDDATSATSRLTHSLDGYVLVDGTPVADDWSDLVDGSLLATISLTESGDVLPADAEAVWTGTDEAGHTNGSNCNNWTSAETFVDGLTGALASDLHWTREGMQSCGSGAHLYCIEQ